MNLLNYLSNYEVGADIKPQVDFDFTMECLRNGKSGDTHSFKEEVFKAISEARMKEKVSVRYLKEESGKVKKVVLTIGETHKGLKPEVKNVRQIIVNSVGRAKEIFEHVSDFNIEYCLEVETWFQKKVNEKVLELMQEGLSEESSQSYAKSQCLNLGFKSFLKDLENDKNNKMEEEFMTKEERETKQAEKYAMEPLMKYWEREGMSKTEGKETTVKMVEKREVVEKRENATSEKDFEVSEDTYEDAVNANDEMVRLLEEVENETTEWEKKKKDIIQKNKISFISDSEAIVETSKDYKYQIVMKALGDGRQRKYNIYERVCNGGTSKRKFGFLEDENIFLVKTIKNDAAVLRDLIDSLRGNYQGKTNVIIKTMQMIERERLLEVEECENEYDAIDMVEDFKQFMLNYPLTYGFVHFEIDGIMEVGIIGDKRVYDEILEKALPKCTRKKINSILKAEGLLKITGNGSVNDKYKCTRALCPATQKKLELPTSKIYNFNFGDDFVKEYVEAYDKAIKKSKGGNQ